MKPWVVSPSTAYSGSGGTHLEFQHWEGTAQTGELGVQGYDPLCAGLGATLGTLCCEASAASSSGVGNEGKRPSFQEGQAEAPAVEKVTSEEP